MLFIYNLTKFTFWIHLVKCLAFIFLMSDMVDIKQKYFLHYLVRES